MKFVLLLCIFLFSASVVSARDKGILNLDSLTFDKIVGGPFPVFVRFDKEYPVIFVDGLFRRLFIKMLLLKLLPVRR